MQEQLNEPERTNIGAMAVKWLGQKAGDVMTHFYRDKDYVEYFPHPRDLTSTEQRMVDEWSSRHLGKQLQINVVSSTPLGQHIEY